MKTIQTAGKLLALFLVVMATSCSSDDNPLNDNPDPQGESHFYELTFTGGPMDGDTFSGTITNGSGTSGAVAVRTVSTNNGGTEEDTMVLTLLDEIHTPNISLGMVMTMNNNQGMDFGPNVTETSSGMTIIYNNYVMNTISGSSTITNYGQSNVYSGVAYAHFTITFSAEMEVRDINQTDTFTTQVTGTINVKRFPIP
ncbi:MULTISPECIES: hypothetical protein [Bizionia]|uniref:Type 1 periplasmic binding fold superfamily protein n=1 Tax=Bizionia algoritergicola TaxID=291187 RepID=A0A5D0QYV1_9FLAO|nr:MULTISPECIES: hypothetical protein [Bizionia]OBX23399.1 hypothetical protein BAA08_04930 [Bizionia sp. APA-3]TYB73394.1 hypothetical protein ES675_06960 [Bizionia algoritergicola]